MCRRRLSVCLPVCLFQTTRHKFFPFFLFYSCLSYFHFFAIRYVLFSFFVHVFLSFLVLTVASEPSPSHTNSFSSSAHCYPTELTVLTETTVYSPPLIRLHTHTPHFALIFISSSMVFTGFRSLNVYFESD